MFAWFARRIARYLSEDLGELEHRHEMLLQRHAQLLNCWERSEIRDGYAQMRSDIRDYMLAVNKVLQNGDHRD